MHISDTGLDNSLETFTASSLIPVNKNPGLGPISVGEVLRFYSRKCRTVNY